MAKVEAIDYGDRRVYPVSAFNAAWRRGSHGCRRCGSRARSGSFAARSAGRASSSRSTIAGADSCLAAADAARAVRRAPTRAARAANACTSTAARSCARRDGRVAAEGAVDRALRARRSPGGARAAQAEARGGGPVRAPSASGRSPRLPRRIGLVTGNDAAAKRDVITAVTARFPPARDCSSPRRFVQGPAQPAAVVDALRAICAEPEVDVVILARGGGSFEDLLPFSDERVVRAVAACPVPVVTPPSATSRTRRSATSPRTFAHRRRRRPRGSSSRTRPSCVARSSGLAQASDAASARSVERHRERLGSPGRATPATRRPCWSSAAVASDRLAAEAAGTVAARHARARATRSCAAKGRSIQAASPLVRPMTGRRRLAEGGSRRRSTRSSRDRRRPPTAVATGSPTTRSRP